MLLEIARFLSLLLLLISDIVWSFSGFVSNVHFQALSAVLGLQL